MKPFHTAQPVAACGREGPCMPLTQAKVTVGLGPGVAAAESMESWGLCITPTSPLKRVLSGRGRCSACAAGRHGGTWRGGNVWQGR